MRTVEARRVLSDEACRALVGKPAPVEPVVNVGAGTLVVDAETGEPVLVVDRYRGDLAALRRAMLAYPMNSTVRAAGIRNRSNVFGFTARHVLMQRNACRACGGAGDAPEAHAGLVAAADVLSDHLADLLPDVVARDRATAEAILPEWRLGDRSPWTSGVLNETSPLPFHFDRNNLPTWSMMVVARRAVRGGHLYVADYDLTIECRDGDVLGFAGWAHPHAVTPLRRVAPDGYRYSAVYYTVAKMRACLPFAEELARARIDRSTREADLRPADERLGARRG